MADAVLKSKEEFIRRKKGIRTEADVVAQRLVNIYRQLSVLGEEAAQTYNKQLTSQINPEILSSLKTIPGGEEVRDYYYFLTHTEKEDAFSGDSQKDIFENRLPKSEELSPLWNTYGVQVANVISPTEQSNMQTSQLNGNAVSLSDIEKKSQLLSEQLDDQKEAIKQLFETIVIDSNIERMHSNLKNLTEEVMMQLDNQKEKALAIINDFSVQPVQKKSEEKDKKRNQSTSSYKNFYKKSDHKFSVDMTEEE